MVVETDVITLLKLVKVFEKARIFSKSLDKCQKSVYCTIDKI